MSRTTDRTIDGLIGHLEALRNELNIAEHCLLDHRRRIIIPWPTGSDEPKVAGGNNTSPTERAALQIAAVDNRLAAYRAELDAIVLIVRNLRRDCQHDARTHDIDLVEEKQATCDGRGLEGFPHWGQACEQSATKAGLCGKCYMRCYRWRRDHGLKPLRDTPAA